jgi:predicted DNA binding CopG/RHH family protein
LAPATGAKAKGDMSKKTSAVKYADEPIELGERVADFLPRPEELVMRNKGVKVTITLSEESVDFFKEQADRLNVPYQRMIRNLVDEYVRHMRK